VVQAANATYQFEGTETIATLTMQQHQLHIDLGNNKRVVWYYDQIMKTEGNTFTYPGYGQQLLRIHDTSFADELTFRMQRQVSSISRKRGSTLLKLLVIFLVLALLFYFLALPRIAAGMADKVSVKYEMELGEQLYQSMKPSFNIDEKKTAYTNDFFRQLNFPSSYPISITVVKSEVPNAFAIPGGHIVIYDRILNGMQSYEELAALLAHELIHIERRHSLQNMFRQLSTKVFFTLLIGNIDVVGGILLNNADNLKQLSYSRSLETEADEQGAKLLSTRHISCEGFFSLFRLLQNETGSHQPNEWFSSHPDLEKRMKNINQLNYCSQRSSRDTILHQIFTQIKK
jgi:Zn-dependent protease with chaperone function